MTVSSQQNRKLYSGDGLITEFSYDFPVFDAAELLVVLRLADDTEQTKTLSVDYSVSGVGQDQGGTVTCLNFTPAVGQQLLIQRRVDYVQETSLPANVDMPSATIERQFDRVVMMVQQVAENLGRTIQVRLTSGLTGLTLPEPSPGKAVVGNDDSDGYTNLDLASVGSLSISDYMRTVLDDADADSARTTLGVGQATFEPGDVKWSAKGLTADPTGWLLCDGRAVDRTTYSDLFTAIGIAHGSGDGATTFNIPDYRGRVLRCPDDLGTTAGAAGLDPDAASRTAMASDGNTGSAVGSIQADALQGHAHTDSGHSHDVPTEANTDAGTTGRNVPNGLASGTPIATQTGQAQLGDPTATSHGTPRLADETRMVNAYVNVLIKI